MPTRKRRRAVPAAKKVLTTSDTQRSQPWQASVHLLPPEVWRKIVDLACLAASSSSSSTPTTSSASRSSFFHSDVPTMLSLNLVCRELHDHVQSKIYREITITRPSALYGLYQVLRAHPERARLVESIHIGPQDILPPEWWPLRSADDDSESSMLFAASGAGGKRRHIASSLAQHELPSSCQDRQTWVLNRKPAGCRQAAVHDALKKGQSSLGIDLIHLCSRPLDVCRVFEAQAMLDLYLQKLRALEQDNPELVRLAKPGARVPLPCRNGQCKHYPPLQLLPLSAATPDSPAAQSNVFTLRREELLHHLARPGALTDRFDHPLIFARSGFAVSLVAPTCEGSRFESPGGHGFQLHHNEGPVSEDPQGSQWPPLAALRAMNATATVSAEDRASNARLIDIGTLGSILRLSRSLLAGLPDLKTLSLTGFLERALAVRSPGIRSLRRLSIGPPPPCWRGDLALLGLESVEDLRICGAVLGRTHIQYLTSNLRRLRVLEWSRGEMFPRPSWLSIEDTIHRLIEDNYPPTAPEGASAPRQGGSDGENGRRSGLAPAASVSGQRASLEPLIFARLHPSDVRAVLDTAPSDDARAAWLAGMSTGSGSRRLLLEHSAPATDSSDSWCPSKDSKSRVWNDLYEEGRIWSRKA